MAQVLVVDDDQDIRETMRFILEDEGHEVFEAPDGLAALDLLRTHPYPLVVLLDFMMPRLDGAGVLGAVAGDHRLATRHAYIMTTASQRGVPGALNNLLTNLSVPILRKPVDIDDLLDAVEGASYRLPSSDGLDYAIAGELQELRPLVR